MRLSTAQVFQQGINAILDQQAKLNKTQLQISTGQRINTPSDDPGGAVQILDFADQIATVEQYQRNTSAAEVQLQLEEGVLVGVGDVLQRIRERIVQSNNGVLGKTELASIATELKGMRDELLGLANSRDANGDYLFSGYQVGSEPFSFTGGAVTYNGDDGKRFIQLGPDRKVPVNDSGADIFLRIPEGNGNFTVAASPANAGSVVAGELSQSSTFVSDNYSLSFSQATPADPVTYQVLDSSAAVVASGTYQDGDTIAFNGAQVRFVGAPADGDSFAITPAANRDIFAVIDDIVNALETPILNDADQAQFHNHLNRSLEGTDNAIDALLRVRTTIGARLNNTESQAAVNADQLLQLQQMQSAVKDLDLASAISTLNLQQVALQAAQQSYVQVQRLSLFQFL